MKKALKNVLTKISDHLKRAEKTYISLTAIMLAVLSKAAYADTPTIVSGTVSLIQAATGWLLILIPGAAGLTLGYFALRKLFTDDEAAIAHSNKCMKNTLIAAAIAESASGIATAVLSFYK